VCASHPRPCKTADCGFFGSSVTLGFCSVCFETSAPANEGRAHTGLQPRVLFADGPVHEATACKVVTTKRAHGKHTHTGRDAHTYAQSKRAHSQDTASAKQWEANVQAMQLELARAHKARQEGASVDGGSAAAIVGGPGAKPPKKGPSAKRTPLQKECKKRYHSHACPYTRSHRHSRKGSARETHPSCWLSGTPETTKRTPATTSRPWKNVSACTSLIVTRMLTLGPNSQPDEFSLARNDIIENYRNQHETTNKSVHTRIDNHFLKQVSTCV
jgi:hypothetical protein